jgi:hypothetical protein
MDDDYSLEQILKELQQLKEYVESNKDSLTQEELEKVISQASSAVDLAQGEWEKIEVKLIEQEEQDEE